MPSALSSIASRLAGFAAILAGVYVIVINKKGAMVSIKYQHSIDSPFSGRLSFWFFRACGVILGIIGILFGTVLLTGHR
jgi:hypothetical protein